MRNFTRYLSIRSGNGGRWRVSIAEASPIAILQSALGDGAELRYSPILPAYLVPGQSPPPLPGQVTSVAFFFSRTPYNALGRMKPELSADELERVYFTQGLASILCLNCDLVRARELREYMSPRIIEFWPLRESEFDASDVVIEGDGQGGSAKGMVLQAKATGELAVYFEQILACIVTLQQSYLLYNPEELETLDRIARLTEQLAEQYREVSARTSKDFEESLSNRRRCNSILSALVELGIAQK